MCRFFVERGCGEGQGGRGGRGGGGGKDRGGEDRGEELVLGSADLLLLLRAMETSEELQVGGIEAAEEEDGRVIYPEGEGRAAEDDEDEIVDGQFPSSSRVNHKAVAELGRSALVSSDDEEDDAEDDNDNDLEWRSEGAAEYDGGGSSVSAPVYRSPAEDRRRPSTAAASTLLATHTVTSCQELQELPQRVRPATSGNHREPQEQAVESLRGGNVGHRAEAIERLRRMSQRPASERPLHGAPTPSGTCQGAAPALYRSSSLPASGNGAEDFSTAAAEAVLNTQASNPHPAAPSTAAADSLAAQDDDMEAVHEVRQSQLLQPSDHMVNKAAASPSGL